MELQQQEPQDQELFVFQEGTEETNSLLDDTHLKCNICQEWRPKNQVKATKDLPLAGDLCYKYQCAFCTDGHETFEFLARSWMDIVQIVIYNLRLRREEELLAEGKKPEADKMFFRFKEDICYFIDKNWNRICFGKSRTPTWNNTIGSSLSSHPELFVSGYNQYRQSGYWSTRNSSNPIIGAGAGSGGTGASVERVKRLKEKRPPTSSTKERKSKKKRRPADANPWTEKRTKTKTKKKNKVPKPAPVIFPGALLYEPDPRYREVCVAKENSARQIQIAPDLLTVANEKGYRMARASHGASEGSWFFEITINSHNGNTRLGWSTEKGDLQAPVGYDSFSFSYRDKEGTIFHQSRGRTKLEPYGPGDTIGFYIHLPPASERPPAEKEAQQEKDVPAIGGAGGEGTSATKSNAGPDLVAITDAHGLAAIPADTTKAEPPLKGTEIRFYKNGRCAGPVFADMIPPGTYYPAASMYNSASVTFKFGPNFAYPPKDVAFTPCSQLVQVLDELLEQKRKAEAEVAAKAEEEAIEREATCATPQSTTQNGQFAEAETAKAQQAKQAETICTTHHLPSHTAHTNQPPPPQPTHSPPQPLHRKTSSASIALLLNPAEDETRMAVEPLEFITERQRFGTSLDEEEKAKPVG